jgi:hypothetical protein
MNYSSSLLCIHYYSNDNTIERLSTCSYAVTLSCCHTFTAYIAVNIAPVAIGGNGISKSCPSEEKLERAIQSIRNSTRDVVSKTKPQCGEGIWHQLVAVNMSSADSQCPDGWVEENEGGVRACGRGSVDTSCQSVYLNTTISQIEYTRVCGRAIGYQYGHPDAFAQRDSDVTVDQNYADGLSFPSST